MVEPCPLCELSAEVTSIDYEGAFKVDCPNCGRARIRCRIPKSPREKAVLSHAIKKMQVVEGPSPEITPEIAKRILADGPLSHGDMADNLLRYLAEKAEEGAALFGKVVISIGSIRAIVGCYAERDVVALLGYLQQAGLLVWESRDKVEVKITFAGWDRIRELQRNVLHTRAAFMAMQYGDSELDFMFEQCFSPAVAATGFSLRRLDQNPKAGIIDNHLRVEIRNARFLLADLTHGNAGAYWEAGFAEGIGRPVLYLCKKDVFEKTKTHFDTNHCQTVLWELGNFSAAGQQIKDAIRATLPAEAQMVE